jgi:hypothetical protein
MEGASSRRRLKRGDCTHGKNRAGVTTKLHLVITPDYQVVEGQLTGGNVADITMADTVTAEIVGCYVVEDMGYDSGPRELGVNNNVPVIPGRKNRKSLPRRRPGSQSFMTRKFIAGGGASRCSPACAGAGFGKPKENRRLAVHYEKTDLAFLGFIALAAIKIHLC